MLKPVNITKEQSLFDVSIQFYGGIQGILWLLEDNPNIKFIDAPSEILIRPDFIREDIVEYLSDRGIHPSTNQKYYKDQFSDQFSNQFS